MKSRYAKFQFWFVQAPKFFIAALLLSLAQITHAGEIKSVPPQAMPEVRWQDSEGNTHRLQDSDGQPRLLHFWAAWCTPCREELPDMLAWQEKNSELLIIPLSLDERMAQTTYFIKKYQLNMPPLLLNKEDSETLNIPALPFTLFIAADGSLTGRLHGIAPWQDESFSREIRQHFAIE